MARWHKINNTLYYLTSENGTGATKRVTFSIRRPQVVDSLDTKHLEISHDQKQAGNRMDPTFSGRILGSREKKGFFVEGFGSMSITSSSSTQNSPVSTTHYGTVP